MRDIVTPCDFAAGLACIQPPQGFLALVWGQFWFATHRHALPDRTGRPSPILARINSRSNSAIPPKTVSIDRPWAVVVWAHASPRDRKPAFFSEIKTSGKGTCPCNFKALHLPQDMIESDLPSRLFGYARVSTYGQTLDAQLEQLTDAGCVKIYREKATGARADRKELLKMLRHLVAGDMVTVTRIDRLARSTFDLFAIVKQIADSGAWFRSLAEPWADTGTSTGRLMLAVLGGLADVERDLIRTRTAEGRSRAKLRGQHMGRPPALTPQQQAEARQRRAEGATLKELARSYNVGIATIARLSRAA